MKTKKKSAGSRKASSAKPRRETRRTHDRESVPRKDDEAGRINPTA